MAKRAKTKETPHQRAEAALTAYALSLPEVTIDRGWGTTRYIMVRKRGFLVFGDGKNEPADALTIIVKLPVSFEMVQDLWFVRESKGWFRQHNWVVAHFDADDDITAELDTLKAWILQSYRARAPKTLLKQLDAQP